MSESVSDQAEIKLNCVRSSRGKYSLTLMQGTTVLFAGEVNPHKADQVNAFIAGASAQYEAIPADELREEILQLAAPCVPSSPANTEGQPLYFASGGGLFWRKPTNGGQVEVQLTNFDARIVANTIKDDGIERQQVFEIAAELNGRTFRFSIPASQFSQMNWNVEHMGPGAIVSAGAGIKDHARTAIQTLSDQFETRTVFTHTGWREIDGQWIYLHAGGAVGDTGPLSNIKVEAPDALGSYLLPPPPTDAELAEAILASLGILYVAPLNVTFPLLCSVYRALFGVCDTSVFFIGPTGAKKSELAALACQHFGPAMGRLNLPANWTSTENSLEGLTFSAKDTLLVIDDFAPGGGQFDVQKLHQKADRVLRAQGNHSSRQRMRADGSLRAPRPPRGTVLSTGEDLPRGVSLRARLIAVDVAPSAVNVDLLSKCQGEARSGKTARAMSAFVQWLAPRMGSLKAEMPECIAAYRAAATSSALHARTPEAVANLYYGFEIFMDFAVDVGVFLAQEADDFLDQCWNVLGQVAQSQRVFQQASDPVQRFLDLIISAVATGNAHLASRDGQAPDQPSAWGWRTRPGSEQVEWVGQGDRIGWLDQAHIYLDPDASHRAAQLMAGAGGEGLSITPQSLRKRLNERGLLMREPGRDELTVRRILDGVQRNVVMLQRSAILVAPPVVGTAHQDLTDLSQ